MLRRLSATGTDGGPSDPLALLKFAFASAAFLATFLAGASAYKLLKCGGDKSILVVSRFTAGALVGTAMLEWLSESSITFHALRCRYPLAFLLSCTGYLVALLVDCLPARPLRGLGFFMKFYLKFLDKMMIPFTKDSQPTKHCDIIISVGTSELETDEESGCIGYIRYVILYRHMLFGDGIFLSYFLGVFSMARGAEIWDSDTETNAWRAFLSATVHSIIYTISLISMLLRLLPNISFAKCLFIILWFSISCPFGIIVMYMDNDSTPSSGEAAYEWAYAILTGFCSGVLVYLSTHHLLADGYEELKWSVSNTPFNKLVAVACGIGLIALVNILDMF